MIERAYTLLNEPEGVDYSNLLSFLFQRTSKCSLVVQPNQLLSSSTRQFLEAVQPYLLEELVQSSWPGTVLQDSITTRVQYYTINWSLFEAMTSAADRLYAWLFPALPEDPAFYRSDGRVLMGTVSHEHDAFLNLSESEFAELSALVTRLRIVPSNPAEDMV